MNPIDPNFDWVSARAKCSPEGVFALLREQVKSDVDKRNGLRSAIELQYDVKFEITNGAAAFRVARIRMGEFLETATFSQTKAGIKVSYGERVNRSPVETSLTLANDQECKLKISDTQEYSFWQFRKLILEPILFSNDMVGW